MDAKSQSPFHKEQASQTGRRNRSGQTTTQMTPKSIMNGVNKTARHNSDHKAPKAGRETSAGLTFDWDIRLHDPRSFQFSQLPLPLFDFAGQQFFRAPAA